MKNILGSLQNLETFVKKQGYLNEITLLSVTKQWHLYEHFPLFICSVGYEAMTNNSCTSHAKDPIKQPFW